MADNGMPPSRSGRSHRRIVVDDHPVARAGIVEFRSKADDLVVRGEGMKPREMAALLSISRTAIAAHKEPIQNKLGVASPAELAARAALWNTEHRG